MDLKTLIIGERKEEKKKKDDDVDDDEWILVKKHFYLLCIHKQGKAMEVFFPLQDSL